MKKNVLKNGFHLIEILIVLSIIVILCSLAFPQYDAYLVRINRLEATNTLSKLSLAMEKYYIENNTYQNITLKKLHFPEIICKHLYQLIIKTNLSDYSLIAKPLGKQATKDKLCASLILNSNGEKHVTGSGKVEECW